MSIEVAFSISSFDNFFIVQILPSKFFVMYYRDVYEGTRVATESDLAGIKNLIRPLEESGVFIQRTDEEVFTINFSNLISFLR